MMTPDKAKNVVQVDKDKIKQATGRHLGNEEMQLAGESDQVKSNFKQCGERVTDAFKK